MSKKKKKLIAKKKPIAAKLQKQTTSFKIIKQPNKKLVLHIGCEDNIRGNGLENRFKNDQWQEVRLAFKDGIVADINADPTNLDFIPDGTFDAIWMQNKIDRFYDYQTKKIFRNCQRILVNDGYLFLSTPNLKDVAEKIYKNGIDQKLYHAQKHDITPLDIFFGLRDALIKNDHSALHKSGFTPAYLGSSLRDCGLLDIRVQRDNYILWAIAHKRSEKTDKNLYIKIINDDPNQMMLKRDAIDQKPHLEVNYP